jgi:uncharacterized hydrophobic protein (TIGR00271 family)
MMLRTPVAIRVEREDVCRPPTPVVSPANPASAGLAGLCRPMITIEVFGESAKMERVTDLLVELDGASRVRSMESASAGHSVVLAKLPRGAVDEILGGLRDLGVPDDDITLALVEEVGLSSRVRAGTDLVWEDVLGQARLNARPITFYLAYMFVAGVIACYGVVDANGILIVGAMAISPDLLPISATAVGLVSWRPGLAGRAFMTLTVGMAVAATASAIFTFAQNQLDLIPSGFNPDATVLGSLTSVNDETIMVALAAGVAGMLALETRASSAVGVAISVTTIPAAAYLGVSVGLGRTGHAGGALAVLGTNVAMMVLGASAALLFQRAAARRSGSALS